MKSSVCQIKIMASLNNRLSKAEEIISNLEDRSLEISQTKKKKTKTSIRDTIK